jgi:hypothetical protein
MEDHQRHHQEAHRLLRDMARLRERMRFLQPWDRPETDGERQEIRRLYVELGKLTEAYSYVHQHGPRQMYQCPCCELYTLEENPPGTYEICLVCWWEDDPIQFKDPNYRGGANHESLHEARDAFRRNGIVGPP